MFQLPQAKRVRRADLYSPTSSPEPASADTSQQERLLAQLAKTYEHDTYSTSFQPTAAPDDRANNATPPAADGHDGAADTQGFEFRLFSNTNTRSSTKEKRATTQRIIIRSPTPPLNSTSGFLIPGRPKSYYFTDALSTARRKQYEHAALTGEDIVKLSSGSRPGCALPWRVLTLPLPLPLRSSKYQHPRLPPPSPPPPPQQHTPYPPTLVPSPKKRLRANKKRRLTIRKRFTAAAKEELSKAERGIAEREKRTRRNREKKVKRKMKEKMKEKEKEGDDGKT